MKTDIYTKTVLTMILVCLIIIVINQLGDTPKFHSISPNSTPDSATQNTDKKYGLVPLNQNGRIEVEIYQGSNWRGEKIPIETTSR